MEASSISVVIAGTSDRSERGRQRRAVSVPWTFLEHTFARRGCCDGGSSGSRSRPVASVSAVASSAIALLLYRSWAPSAPVPVFLCADLRAPVPPRLAIQPLPLTRSSTGAPLRRLGHRSKHARATRNVGNWRGQARRLQPRRSHDPFAPLDAIVASAETSVLVAATPPYAPPVEPASVAGLPITTALYLLSAALLVGFWAAVFNVIRQKTQDPGRESLAREWSFGGRDLVRLPIHRGDLVVTSYKATQSEPLPAFAVPGSPQEWRALRFEPAEGTSNLVQSVTKVVLQTPQAPIVPGSQVSAGRMRGDCLPLGYTKVFATTVLATLSAMGRSLSREPLRFLCIGLGGGSVPTFFADNLPECVVDVAELEPSVVRAATEGMGFMTSSRLRVEVTDGAAFALQQAEQIDANGHSRGAPDSNGNSVTAPYDAVLIDAYDAAGGVPEPFRSREGAMAKALSLGLVKAPGLVAINFLPGVNPTPVLEAYESAFAERSLFGKGFSVTTPYTGNRIVVQSCGSLEGIGIEDLCAALHDGAVDARKATKALFPMEEYLGTHAVRDWGLADVPSV